LGEIEDTVKWSSECEYVYIRNRASQQNLAQQTLKTEDWKFLKLSECENVRTIGSQSDLYNKHTGKKVPSPQLDTNEVFQIKWVDHETNDNLFQIKGAGDHGLYLYAHSNTTSLGCLNEYSSEDQTTFFELT